jgi:hypothetical protein
MNAPPPPLPIKLDVTRGVRTLMERALRRHPDRRYTSTREMIVDLTRLGAGRPLRPSTLAISDGISIDTD